MSDAAPPSLPELPASARVRARELIQRSGRVLLGLVGPPGAGKSTLAAALQAEFASVAQVVPMDGFHLANVELERLGRRGRKGAPDTFDSAGYVALLRRLLVQPDDEIVYAPEFRREIEEPIANAIPIHARTQLVITEGNYLLLEEGPWAQVKELLDEIWYVDIPDEVRVHRLTKRHEQFGRTAEDAAAWVANTDEPNARLIEASRARASFVFRWDDA
ncbi:nucleoside/nucleotide kinase family protein [Scleromatobacter humisilvae]|uniref:Nucleoside/nucleotide kinase family protein n=1 Tax=Scleromatobacter humisilvae TaxID=2897159 RepID=A0A9X1YMJ6_9BURK|nr:nucleoside/nucleotide kinase family protein [Scleromatobacter humisilvae]MCK9689054.1 nucleoside/nucleotide kinase family protein [Scleromatobacter humisilvae]